MKTKHKNIFRKTVNRLQPQPSMNSNSEQNTHGLGIDYTMKKYVDDQYIECLKNVPDNANTIKINKSKNQTILKDNQCIYFIDKENRKCLIVSISDKHRTAGFHIDKVKFLSDRIYVILESIKLDEQIVKYAFDLSSVINYSTLKDQFDIA